MNELVTSTPSLPLPALATAGERASMRFLQFFAANIRDEINKIHPRRPLSHGFRRKQSIIDNARKHRRCRFVLNLDLKDFFPTLNFGRVRGFFIKNRDFTLDEKAATVIAQIACFENTLPQGSPCSPIIADMLAHILDVRLVRLAKAHRVTYSRYADDLTFSTNERVFPGNCSPPRNLSPPNHRRAEPG